MHVCSSAAEVDAFASNVWDGMHLESWQMQSKFALDASKRGHSQPEATDVVSIGRQEADPRLGSRLCASWFSVVRREGERRWMRRRSKGKPHILLCPVKKNKQPVSIVKTRIFSPQVMEHKINEQTRTSFLPSLKKKNQFRTHPILGRCLTILA